MPRDDRGAALVALIGRLSAYQLRTHYVLYEHARRVLATSTVDIEWELTRKDEARTFIPYSAWEAGMELDSVEQDQAGQILVELDRAIDLADPVAGM